jgi:hypothetical protein
MLAGLAHRSAMRGSATCLLEKCTKVCWAGKAAPCTPQTYMQTLALAAMALDPHYLLDGRGMYVAKHTLHASPDPTLTCTQSASTNAYRGLKGSGSHSACLMSLLHCTASHWDVQQQELCTSLWHACL